MSQIRKIMEKKKWEKRGHTGKEPEAAFAY